MLALLSACASAPDPEPQKWYEITPDITATLKYGVDGQRYALGAVSDYASPAGTSAETLVYVARAAQNADPIARDTATEVAAKFANVTLCSSGQAGLTQEEPPVYRRDINSWAIALTCA